MSNPFSSPPPTTIGQSAKKEDSAKRLERSDTSMQKPRRSNAVGNKVTQAGTKDIVKRGRANSTQSPTKARSKSRSGSPGKTMRKGLMGVNNVDVNKFIKWNPSGDKKDPRRHMGSSEAHARRQRIARERAKNPALVDQLLKDLKKELGGRQGQTVEQMRRMMGASATRSFLHRALFKRVAKAFYHWLCGGVDASLMGRLKQALDDEKDFTQQLEAEVKLQQEEQDELRAAQEELKLSHAAHGAELGGSLAELEENYEKVFYVIQKARKKIIKSIFKKFKRRESLWGLRRWKRRVFGNMGKYKKMMRAATWFTNKHVRKTWRAWQIYLRIRHEERRKMLKSSAFMHNKSLSVGFYRWGKLSARRQMMRKLLLAIFSKKVARVRSKAYKRWQGRTIGSSVAVELRHQNKRLTDELAQLKSSYEHNYTSLSLVHMGLVLRRNHAQATSEALRRWKTSTAAAKAIAKRQEALLKRGGRKLYRRMLTRDVATWKEYARKRHQVKRLLRRITKHTFKRFYRKFVSRWRSATVMIRERERKDNLHKNKMNRILGRLCNGLLSMAWKSWSDGAAAARRREVILERAARKMRNRKLNASMQAWVACRNLRQHKRRVLTMILSRLCNGKMSSGFNKWKTETNEWIRHEVIMYRVAHKIKRRELAQAFEGWISYWEERIRHKVLLARAAERILNKRLTSAMYSWGLYVKYRTYARGLAFRVFNRVVNGKMAAAWTSWSDLVNEGRKHEAIMGKISRRMMNRQIAGAYSAWVALVTEQRRHRLLLQRAAGKMMMRRLSSSLEGWLDYVDARLRFKVLAFKIFRRLEHAMVLKGLNTWKERAENLRKYEINIRKATMMWRNRALGATYQTWKANAKEMARNGRLLRRFAKKINRRKLFAAWGGWEDAVKERKENRVKVERCMKKIRNKTIAMAFSSWTDYYRARLRARHLANRVFQRIVNGKCMSALVAWKDAVSFMQRMEVILARAGARLRNRHVTAAMNSWVEMVENAKRDRFMLGKALAMMKNRIAGAAFSTWNDKAKLAIIYRRKVSLALHRLQHRRVLGSWSAWMKYLEERQRIKTLVNKVIGRLKHSKVHSGWQTWQAYVAMKNRYLYVVSKASRRMKNRRIAAAYTSWVIMWERACRERLILERCARKMKYRRSSMVFDCWYSFTEEALRRKYLVVKATKMWKNRELSKVFLGWKTNIEEKLRNKLLLKRAALKLKNRLKAQSFMAWDDYVEWRIRGKYLVRKTLGGLAYGKQSSAFRKWLSVMALLRWEDELRNLSDDDQKKMRDAQRQKEMALEKERREAERRRRMVKRVIGRVRNRTTGRALDAWCAEIAERKRVRVLLKRAALKIKHRVLFQTWDAWKFTTIERIENRVKVRKCLKRMHHARVAAAMTGWYDAVRSAKTNRLKVARTLKRMKNRMKGSVFDSWQDAIVIQRRNNVAVNRCLLRMKKRDLDKAFVGWYDAAQDRIRNRWLVGRILGRLLNSQYVAAFSTWHGKVLAAKRAEATGAEVDPVVKQMRRVVKRMMNSFLNSGWLKWNAWIAEQKRHEAILKNVMRKWRYKTLAATMDGWTEAVANIKRHRAMVKRAARKWKHRTTAAVWSRWAEYTIERKENRIKVTRFLYKMKNKVVVSSWSAWASLVNDARRHRNLVARAAAKWKNKMASVAFEAWYHMVETVKRHRFLVQRAAKRWQQRAAAGAFLAWDDLRGKRKRLRHLLNGMGSQNDFRLLRAGLGKWKVWFAGTLKPVGDKFIHAMKTCLELREKSESQRLQKSCDLVVEKLRMLLLPAAGAAERHKKWLLKREKQWKGRITGGIPKWVYKPVAPVWSTEELDDEHHLTDEEEDDKRIKDYMFRDPSEGKEPNKDDANTAAAKAILGPRILTPAQAKRRRLREAAKKRGGSPLAPPKSARAGNELIVVNGSFEVAEEAARQLGENEFKMKQDLADAVLRRKEAFGQVKAVKEQMVQIQQTNSLHMEMMMQKSEEASLKLNQVIERQKQDVQALQMEFDTALHKIKKLGDASKKQERRYLLALEKKQQAVDHELEEKRRLEGIVIAMGKRQGEKMDETMSIVDMTIRRRTRPTSASSTKSRMSLRANRSPITPTSPVTPSGTLVESKQASMRPKSANIRVRARSKGRRDRRRPGSAASSRPNSRGSLSPYVLGVKHTHEDEMVSEIATLKREVQDKLEELNAKETLVSQLQYDVQTLHSDLHAANEVQTSIEVDVNKRIEGIRKRARKQLQYQHAKCSSLEAKVKQLEDQLSQTTNVIQPRPKTAWNTPKAARNEAAEQKKLEETALANEAMDPPPIPPRPASQPQARPTSPVQWAQSVKEVNLNKGDEGNEESKVIILPSRAMFQAM